MGPLPYRSTERSAPPLTSDGVKIQRPPNMERGILMTPTPCRVVPYPPRYAGGMMNKGAETRQGRKRSGVDPRQRGIGGITPRRGEEVPTRLQTIEESDGRDLSSGFGSEESFGGVPTPKSDP